MNIVFDPLVVRSCRQPSELIDSRLQLLLNEPEVLIPVINLAMFLIVKPEFIEFALKFLVFLNS